MWRVVGSDRTRLRWRRYGGRVRARCTNARGVERDLGSDGRFLAKIVLLDDNENLKRERLSGFDGPETTLGRAQVA